MAACINKGVIQSIRTTAASIIQNHEAEVREIHKWKILASVITNFNGADTNREMVSVALSAMVEYLNVDGGAAFLVNREAREAVLIHSINTPDRCREHFSRISIDDHPQSELFVHGDTVITHDFVKFFNCKQHEPDTPKSFAAVPIISPCGIVGALCVFSYTRREIDADDISILYAICEGLGSSLRRLWAENKAGVNHIS